MIKNIFLEEAISLESLSTSPLISIAMATYNGEKYLKEQLESIYAQTYKNIEVIVTDDCSTDKTVEILKQYAASYQLKYFVNEQNLGYVKNFEKAISLCSGDFIALSDQDDIWETDKLEVLLNKIGSNLLIHSDCSIIDNQSNMIKPYWKEKNLYHTDFRTLLFKNVVTGCTVLFNKDLLNGALPFPEGIAYHDWWLALYAAKHDRITYTSKCLTQYRQHNEQNTGIRIGENVSYLRRIFLNIMNRMNNIDIHRIVAFRTQKQNLLAIQNNTQLNEANKVVLNDALAYIEDYLSNKLHLKTFYIGMKYHKILYTHKNYMFVKNVLMDIIG